MLKKISAELLFVIYIFSFILLRPVFYYTDINSTLLLIASSAVIIVLYLCKMQSLNVNRALTLLAVCLGWLCIIGVQKLVNPNSLLNQYIEYFFIYTAIPLFLLLNVRCFDKVLLYYYRISILIGVLFVLDPLFEYRFAGDYMQYGFNLMMFSYAGLLIGLDYFNKKILWLPIIFELFCIAFWGNKGAFVASAVLLVFVWFKRIKQKITQLFLFVCGIIGAFFYDRILLILINFAESLGIQSYSITTFKIMISSNANLVYDSRLDIWREAIVYIKESPILGHGIATFEAATGGYPHNIFLDIALTFGLFGLLFFLCILVHSIIKLCQTKNRELKIFQSICLLCWIVPLQFSLTFWSTILFWVYWGIYLYGFLNQKKVCENVE